EKNKGLDKMVELITISIDTPFAQKRFAKETKINNVTFLSDYRGGDFGKAHGLFLKEPHILARTVMIVDAQNTIRYLQITPELAQLPDMDQALTFARSLIAQSCHGALRPLSDRDRTSGPKGRRAGSQARQESRHHRAERSCRRRLHQHRHYSEQIFSRSHPVPLGVPPAQLLWGRLPAQTNHHDR